jgi:hypothetical protein
MNSINLSSYYRLYAFSDYQSMKAALPYMRGVVLSKNLNEVDEAEARKVVERTKEQGYKNYLQPLNYRNYRVSAFDSLITALQLLYKSNGYSARYVVVERR